MAFTHVASGVFLGAACCLVSRQTPLGVVLLLAGGVVGSLLPDIDHPKSWLGRRIPFISIPLSAMVGHRGVTHSLLAVAATSLGLLSGMSHWSLAMGTWAPMATGICLGYLSHLFGDWASNSGIPIFWPNKRRYKSPVPFFTGSAEERVMAWAMWGLSVYMLVNIKFF